MIEQAVHSSPALICTPVRRDAELLKGVLQAAGVASGEVPHVSQLERGLGNESLALLTTEEVLVPPVVRTLRSFIDDQPLWSDFPIVIFTGPDSDHRYLRRLEELGPRANVTLVDRPVRMKSVVSIVQAVARARTRQYEIRDLLAKLEDRITERDRFLAILGHELRNPLGAIVLAAQMVDPLTATLDAQHAERIERQAHHLSSLVDDLLDLSRITTGKIALKLGLLELSSVVRQCVESQQGDSSRREIGLSFQAADEPLVVHADALRVEQIITNLITNALKYTTAGGRIAVRTEKREGKAAIVVSDTGVGISRQRIDSIFELFSQAENAIGRAQGGMGIGLHLVRTLVQLHGGEVEARSPGLDQGSTFTVTLPLAEEQAVLPAAAPSRPTAAELVCATRRIVIVDDNADIRDLLQLKLKKLGHLVETASDGHSGLRRITESRPDVAIIDIGMPGLDGYEVARRVREDLSDPILLIALTGFGQADDKDKATAAGFDAHLTKPIRVEELQQIFVRRFNIDVEATA